MHLVIGTDGPWYVATTAGFIRAAFGPEQLRMLNLATLPGALPEGDIAVLLYGTLNNTVASLLNAIRDGRAVETILAQLAERVVHCRPFPWESDGSNG